jgi:hypothetical protein
MGALLMSLAPLGCGSAEEVSATESVGSVQDELLTAPGAWYTTRPHFAWCTFNSASPVPGCVGGFSHNSQGGANTVTQLGTGRYRVALQGMASAGNYQVVALGTSDHCNPHTFAVTASGVSVDVTCRTGSGALHNSSFVLSYLREVNRGGVLGAYARVRGTVNPPQPLDSWNSSGAGITATRLGVGQYSIDFANQSSPNDTVLVTAASPQLGHCKARAWGNVGGPVGAVRVLVDCYNFFNAFQDNDFSVSYGRNIRGDARNSAATGTQGGFSRVSAAGVTNPSFSRNICAAGGNSSTRTGVGTYADRIHALSVNHAAEPPTVALTGAVGAGPSYCNLGGLWGFPPPPADPVVNVRCFNGTGSATQDSEHTAEFMFQQGPGGC